MKKSLSLIASSVILSTSMVADSIDEAFQNSKVKGEIKAAYVDSNFIGSVESDSILATGGSLNLITGNVYDFKAGFTFQTSSVVDEDIDMTDASILDTTTGISNRVNYYNASGSVLSEAYLEYAPKNTSVKIGRQFINTPLVSSGQAGKSSEAIVNDSFEAYVITNTSIENTTLVAGYVDKYQGQTDANGDVDDFSDVEDGATTIYVENKSIENTTIQAQYLSVSGKTATADKDALYLQVDYQMGSQTLSAQYLSSTDKSQASNAQDGTAYGLKATGPLGISNLAYIVGYNASTDDNAGVYSGAGEGTADLLFTALPVHGGGVPARSDNTTLVGALIVPTSVATLIAYGGQSSSDTNVLGDVKAYGAMAIAPLSKSLVFKFNYEFADVENIVPEDTKTTKLLLSYNF